jgi:glycosyltransferase involved in cell wall biosynthesis
VDADARQRYRYRFTVFTPTYDLAHTLPRAYESLQAQTFKDFEWLIIDDESTDDTEDVVRPWLTESEFPIRYVRQPNVGKHISTNRASDLASGELLGVLDADDWYAPQALERFLYHWESIPADRRHEFAGVVALCADPSGQIIGAPFPEPVMDSDYLEMQFKYRVSGDKVGVARTEIHRQFKYPELEYGGWVQDTIVYNRMARHYKARLFNEVLMFKEYQAGGMSAVGGIARTKSPRSAQLYYRELIEMRSSLPRLLLFRYHANYARFGFHAREGISGSRTGAASFAWWAASVPVGLGLYLRDRLILRRLAKVRPQQ